MSSSNNKIKSAPKGRRITAMEAAHLLGLSREQVFTLSRNGVVRRSGYMLRNGKHVTLFNASDVKAEAARRKAAAGDAGKSVREVHPSKGGWLFTEWLAAQGDYGLCAPPIDPDTAFQFVKDYLLPEGWLDTMPQSARQTDCSALHEVLMEHSPRYRREYASYRGGKGMTVWQRVKAHLGW